VFIADFLTTFRLNRWAWQARRARPGPLAAAIAGTHAKLVGVIVAEEPLLAPFTGTPCVAWMAQLAAKTNLVRSGSFAYRVEERVYREEFQQIVRAPFGVDVDGGGRVQIENGATSFSLFLENVNEHPHVNDENAAFVAFMRAAGFLTTQHMGIAGEYRFSEATLRAGDRVSVYGTVARSSVIVAGAYRGGMEEQTSLSGDDAKPLIVTRA
jgi:hypothetical protein